MQAKFTESEEADARKFFKLSQEDLTTVLESCSYIFEQAAYHGARPDALRDHLAASGLEATKARALALVVHARRRFCAAMRPHCCICQAAIFHKVWAENGEAYLTKLKDNTLGTPQVFFALRGSCYRARRAQFCLACRCSIASAGGYKSP